MLPPQSSPARPSPLLSPHQHKRTPSAPAKAADHFYSVHLFSFKRPDFARSAAQNIAAQTGQPVFVRETHLPGSGTWQRVYVGMFPSEAAAKAFGGKMKSDAVSDYFSVYKLSAPLAAAIATVNPQHKKRARFREPAHQLTAKKGFRLLQFPSGIFIVLRAFFFSTNAVSPRLQPRA